ncbi:MAG TPA: circularly permuted type 2 ATP-grasp protein [Steroidobacteraceae bacterium]|nr:circularly permuted type 2 ATP-grasp protein [Steroidobacteraceae bacterium]
MRAVLEPTDLRRYDELTDATGGMRAHWRGLIDRLRADESPDAVRRSLELTRRLVVENGVTYNVYADPQGADRPWALDPLPFVLPAAEWRALEAGVAQRARLLNALLGDLYGPQKLLAEGHVPAELPFGHPNYLWPCHGIRPVDGQWLNLYGADLARAPDGRWWLLADRTQAPSGAGYALENREILEQVHAETIPDLSVRRVRGFFNSLRERLLSVNRELAAADEAPLAVILTPGPYNETYFEHAYLARQLGMPLVEGSDLTVRGDTVYLKTLGGLRRVHSILRRLDDDYCDPLELRGDSALGVPGLIGALRAGRVVVSNAPGTGVLESAAWLGFLPPIAERLIGEKLLLPEVATWWLGEKPALDYVLDNLDRLVIKPAYPNQRFEPMFGRDYEGKARDGLVARIRNRPYAYVAQEHVRLSQAPVWKSAASTELASRALTIRVYAVVTPEGVRVMPGGLARVAQESAADVVSTQRGGGAKDIWVLAENPHEETLSAPPRAAHAQRHDHIPSRLVENLYWLGRYSVRAENDVRLLLRTLAARSDARVYPHARQICRDLGAVAPDGDVFDALRAPDAVGIAADVKHLAWCASQVRNRLSARYWRGVVGLQRQVQESAASRGSTREAGERILLSLAALTGFSEEDMMHDEGWRVMRLGRRIERMQFIAGVLVRQLAGAQATRPEAVEWLLEVCDSMPIYRARYIGAPRLSQMLNLLLYDDGHPMALVFLRRSIDRDLDDLARSLNGERERGVPDVPLVPSGTADLLDVAGQAGGDARAHLAAELATLAARAGELSDRLSRRYFALIESDAHALAT